MPTSSSVTYPSPSLSSFWPLSYAQINSVVADREIFSSFCKLPAAIRIWSLFEQKFNAKIYDPTVTPSVINYSLDQQFNPENRPVIELEAYRIPNTQLQTLCFQNSPLLAALKDGQDYILLVHPTVRQQGSFMVPGLSRTQRRFFFTPFASPRTGVTWELGREHSPFITKMTIVCSNGADGQNEIKTDLSTEGPMSVHKSWIVLDKLSQVRILPSLEVLYEEAFMHIDTPQRGSIIGVLLRPISEWVRKNRLLFVPFFSLAYTPTDRSVPLLLHCIQKSRLTPLQFLMEHLYLPVIKFIFTWSQQNLYASHLHGQNLLIGLNVDFSSDREARILGFSGHIQYRDVGDMQFPEALLNEELRKLRDQEGAKSTNMTRGAYIYVACQNFVKLSLYPIVTALQNWKRSGLIQTDHQIQADDYMFGFYQVLLNFLTIQLTTNLLEKHFIEYSDILRSLQECREFSNQEVSLYRGTKRQRDWLTRAADLFSKESTVCHPQIETGISPQREQHKREYLRQYLQKLTMDAQNLDSQSTDGQRPYTQSSFIQNPYTRSSFIQNPFVQDLPMLA